MKTPGQLRLLKAPSWMGLWCAVVAPFFFGGLAAIAGVIALQTPASLWLIPFLIVPTAFGVLLGARRGSWPIVLCVLGSLWWGLFALGTTAIASEPADPQMQWILNLVPIPASALFLLGVFLRRRFGRQDLQRV